MRRAVTPTVAVLLVVVGILGMIATAAYVRPLAPSAPATASGMDAVFIERMIPHHDTMRALGG